MSSQSKRKTPRASIEIRVEYQKFNSFVADYTRDISRGGLFIRTEEPMEVGEACFLTLTFPDWDEPVVLNAEVRRVVQPSEGPHPGMGIAFLFSDDQERAAFHRVIDHIIIEQLGAELYARLSGVAPSDATGGMQALDSSVNMTIDSLNLDD